MYLVLKCPVVSGKVLLGYCKDVTNIAMYLPWFLSGGINRSQWQNLVLIVFKRVLGTWLEAFEILYGALSSMLV